jgi:hypothetical protein
MTDQDKILALEDQVAGLLAEVAKLDQQIDRQVRLLDMYADMIRSLMDYTAQ